MKSWGKSIRAQELIYGILFVLPAFVLLLYFQVYPIISGFFISFREWDIISAPKMVGLQNYIDLFKDQTFIRSMWNTLYYVVGTVPATIILSLCLAMLLNQKLRGTTIYRAVYFVPVISSTVAVAVVWRWIFNTDYGFINLFLYQLGAENVPNWLGSSKWAMPSLIIMGIWRGLGINIVILLSGLQGIPSSLYEAARIDGANSFRLFRHITLPLISPTTFFVLIMAVISSFQVFDQVMLMTEGGPGTATNVVVFNIYKQAFENFRMGYASAMAYVLFVVILIITLIQWYGRKKWVFSEVE